MSARKVSDRQAWSNLFKRQYRPSLVLACAIPTFQQWTGINAVGGWGWGEVRRRLGWLHIRSLHTGY